MPRDTDVKAPDADEPQPTDLGAIDDVPVVDAEGATPSVGFDADAYVDVGAKAKKPILFWIATGWLGLVVLAAILAPFLPLHDPNRSDFTSVAVTPNSDYWLGTDAVGRDILSRAIFGARISLVVGLASVLLGMSVGGLVGLIAGYLKGRVEAAVMVVTDALLAFPAIVLLLALMAVLGQSLPNLILGLAVLSVPTFIRLSRASALVLSQQEFVIAARAYGSRSWRVIMREIVPNVIPPMAAYGFVIIAVVIVAEGSLSFLGLGVPPPESSWGAMIANGRRDLTTIPHIALIPATIMFVTVLAFNLVGERLRKRFDVKEGAL
ncbi:MAG: ABC transporter permease [Actinomycetota bacterium]